MPNRLADQTSPYLRQHADNPVDWWPFCDEAFALARETDRPVLLSVGYSSCHWCHVMAHESFEDPEIAAQLGRDYISIKVDREELPDVDQIYQHTLQLFGEHGGWPLTMFLLPTGEPFFGGTYFPPQDRYGRPSFRRVMAAVVFMAFARPRYSWAKSAIQRGGSLPFRGIDPAAPSLRYRCVRGHVAVHAR